MDVKNIIFVALLLCAFGCQIPYEAEVEEKIGLISVEGSIVKGDSIQTIVLSRSTSLYTPEFIPVTGCIVTVEDELGTQFNFTETVGGVYKHAISQDDLVFGRKYKILFTTPEGEEYESSYELLNQGAPVDAIYAEREIEYIASEDEESDGLQFYLDLNGSESDSRYYRWGLTESWEYHSISTVDSIKTGDTIPAVYIEDPYKFYYCWKTKQIPGLYSSSTVNLTSNQKKKIPLHFVSGNTDRLGVKYSLLVEQYSLNEGAYTYWNRTKVETQELGALHAQQPGQIQSNLINVNDADEVVLGYFWVSAKTEKRIFISRPSSLIVYRPPCELVPVDYEDASYPLYMVVSQAAGTNRTSRPVCMDCLLLGGTNIKPDFWE